MGEKISMDMFRWIIGSLLVITMSVLAYQQTQLSRIDGALAAYKDLVFSSLAGLSRDISTVQNDISWIKQTLSNAEIK